jgi:hypothetical protein
MRLSKDYRAMPDAFAPFDLHKIGVRCPFYVESRTTFPRGPSVKKSQSVATLHVGVILLAFLVTQSLARSVPQSQTNTAAAPHVKVGTAVAAAANSPGPSSTAKNQAQKTSIGTGAAAVKSSGPAAYWTDLVDIDDDGQVEDNQFLFDSARGILYTYREDNYTCMNGTPENGSVLMGIYTKGNKTGQPAGSGWYMVAVKAGQCGMKNAGTFGCRFDASGKLTQCGTAKVNEKSGELEVAIKQ